MKYCVDRIIYPLAERNGRHALLLKGVSWPLFCLVDAEPGHPLVAAQEEFLLLPLGLPDMMNTGDCLALITAIATEGLRM